MTAKRNMPGILLLAGFCLCLLYIWLPAYFVTGDGPSHVYNAQIVHDLWANKNVAFYLRFYDLVYQPNPNWLATLAIATLLFVVNGIVAEKLFFTAYLLLYVSGFWLLLKKISGGTSYLATIILVLVFPQTLSKGFYNFSFSIAFYFWVVWCWLCFLDKKSIGNALLFFLFSGLCFFTHLLAFGFEVFTCAALTMSYAWASDRNRVVQPARYSITYAALLALLLSPFLVLMRWFTEKEGGLQVQVRPHLYRLVELAEGKYLVNVTHPEDVIAQVAALLLLVLFCFSSFKKEGTHRIHRYDGLLLSLAFALFVYLCFPESFLGRLILISMRAQLFVYALMACCIAYRFPERAMKLKDAFIIVIVFVIFSVAQVSSLLSAKPGTLAVTYTVPQMIAISIALQVCVLLFVFYYAIRKMPFGKMMNGACVILYLCFIAFTGVRLSCMLTASAAVADYTSAQKVIKPNSIVLPLDFAPCGKDEHGRIIADRNFLFAHAGQYMGLDKPIIILDNYEANMGYFPLRWKEQVNPYFHLSKDEGIEAQPPAASLAAYKQSAGVDINYILLWCYDSSYLGNAHFSELYMEINAGYHQVYSSKSGRSVLFEKN